MNLINKEDDVPLGFDFVHQSLDAAFKLAAELGTCHQRRQIQQLDFLFFQPCRNISGGNPLGQSLGNGGFTYTGFADETGIVFGSAGKDLNDPVNFPLTSDNGIQFPIPGPGS